MISRVVDRRFVLGTEAKEKFRALMRMQENFSGCRVLSYCLMGNHFHLLLEVPRMADSGLSDQEFLKWLSAIDSEAFVAGVEREFADAKTVVDAYETGLDEAVKAIHQRFGYDPSAALQQEAERKARAQKLRKLRRNMDRDTLAAKREARRNEPPATVRAGQEIFLSFPTGWPPDPYPE